MSSATTSVVVVDVSDIRYAKVGRFRIAYQVFGEGPRTVYVPPIVSHIEMKWEHEFHRRILDHMGSFLRVAHFDKRGIGLSDRFEVDPTLDERIDDIAAVMDAEGWDSANVFGMSEGADMALLFAQRYPERVDRLALLAGSAPASSADEVERLSGAAHRPYDDIVADFMQIAETWGEDPRPFARLMAPTRVDDPAYLRWANRLNRLAASPAGFMAQLLSVGAIDDRADPTMVEHDTLVVHLTGDRVRPIGHGRRLAELLPHSTLVEVDGDDHLLYSLPNWREVIDPMIEFFTGVTPAIDVHRHFAVVVFTDIVGSTNRATEVGDNQWRDLIDTHDSLSHRTVTRHGGHVVKSTGDGMLALFPAPSSAIEAVTELRERLAVVGLTIRIGIHAGEVEDHLDGDISGLAVNLAARVEQAAPDDETYVSSTVQQLLLGTDVVLVDVGEHSLKGIEGNWRLYKLA